MQSAKPGNLFLTACLLTIVGAMNGCANQQSTVPTDEISGLAATFLTINELPFADTSVCLPTQRYRQVDVVNEDQLLFSGTADRYWLNELKTSCPLLDTGETMMFELSGNRLCEFDSVRSVDLNIWYWSNSPPCVLGVFKRLTAEQAALLQQNQ